MVKQAYGAWKGHYKHVMDIDNERFFLRGLYKISTFFGAIILCFGAFVLIVVLMSGPMLLADWTGNSWYLVLFSVHLVCIIMAVGSER